jgi:hypothetical protein
MYNLKPWVHLSNATSELVFDPDAHGTGNRISLEMVTGMTVSIESIAGSEEYTYPGRPVRSVDAFGNSTISLGDEYAGTVFEKPFEPVSDLCLATIPSRQTSYRWTSVQ